jgi:hypothetical protein
VPAPGEDTIGTYFEGQFAVLSDLHMGVVAVAGEGDEDFLQ